MDNTELLEQLKETYESEIQRLKDKIETLEKRCSLAESTVNSMHGLYLNYEKEYKAIYK